MSDIVEALQDVEQAIQKVEQAVKDKPSTVAYIAWLLVGLFLISLPEKAWHSKWRYALEYGVSSHKVQMSHKPHDCAFLAAPLGEKYCHYERTVSTLRWATSTTGNAIVSDDEGKTWSSFTPEANVRVPKNSTVEEVYVSWEKKEED